MAKPIAITITTYLSDLSCITVVITAPPMISFDRSNKYLPNSLEKRISSFRICSYMTGTGTILVLCLFFIVK